MREEHNTAAGPTGKRRIIRERECAHLTGLSRCHRWRLERDGKFPKRLRLGEVAHGWLASEIDAWITEREAERDALDSVGGREARQHAIA